MILNRRKALLSALLPALAAAIPAPTAVAQDFQLFNCRVGGNAQCIDWNGKPALLLIASGPMPLATFFDPKLRPSEPAVSLQLLAAGVLDTRPCAAGNLVALDEGSSHYMTAYSNLPRLDAAGCFVGYPGRWSYSVMQWHPWGSPMVQPWNFSYCGAGAGWPACYGGCGPNDRSPMLTAVIVTL